MRNRSDETYGPGRGANVSGFSLLLCGVGIGAWLMYIFDPRSGRRRRALIGDQVRSKINDLSDAAGSQARHLSNRARGLVAEAGSMLSRGAKGAGTGGGRNQAGSVAA